MMVRAIFTRDRKHRTRRWLWAALAASLCVVAVAYSYRYQIAWSFFDLLDPGEPFQVAEPAPDYETREAWAIFEPKASTGLSVIYVHPTAHVVADT